MPVKPQNVFGKTSIINKKLCWAILGAITIFKRVLLKKLQLKKEHYNKSRHNFSNVRFYCRKAIYMVCKKSTQILRVHIYDENFLILNKMFNGFALHPSTFPIVCSSVTLYDALRLLKQSCLGFGKILLLHG